MAMPARVEGKRFWQLVAEELRAEAARQRVGGVELARRMHRSQSWVSRRMVGDLALGLDELEAFAEALSVPVTRLLPRLDSNQKPAVLRRLHLVEVPEQRQTQRHLRLAKSAQ